MDSKWYSEERGNAASHEEHTEAEPRIVYRRFMPAAISSLILVPCSVNINVGEAYKPDNPAGCPGHFPLSKQYSRCEQKLPIRSQKPSIPVPVEKQTMSLQRVVKLPCNTGTTGEWIRNLLPFHGRRSFPIPAALVKCSDRESPSSLHVNSWP